MAGVLKSLQRISLLLREHFPPLVSARHQWKHASTVASTVASTSNLIAIPGVAQPFHPVWLRQNCRCPDCFNHDTLQNNILPHQIRDAKALEVEAENDDVIITWKDGHQSTYSARWLAENSYPGQEDKTKKLLWNGDQMRSVEALGGLPRIAADQLMSQKDSLKELLHSLVRFGIGLIKGVPATIEDTRKCVERVNFIEETMFGQMWAFTSNLERLDTAYTNVSIGSHTDTTYLTNPVGIQVFHCLHHDGDGGETVLVDGFNAAENLRKSDPKAFDLLATTRIHHHYTEPGWNTQSLDSILKVHPVSGELECIRFNHYDRSPITTISQHEIHSYYEALAALSHFIEQPDSQYWVKLKPGTVLLLDNWRVLHGRTGFTGTRKMCGCYLPRAYWQGLARTFNLL